MNRTKKSTINLLYSFILSVATVFIGLIAQKVFINILGTEYLGINGLFTSIVSMLALVELGLGSAIYYHLYKPVAYKDTEKIKTLIEFYKKGYRFIAIAVTALGLLFMPFLNFVVGAVNISESIYIIYLLFLIDVVVSYLLIYKRAVLYVDQNNHIISSVHLGYLIALNGSQIAVLITTGNYYLYLIIKIVMRLLENIVLTIISNKKYPYLKQEVVNKLDSATKSDIYKKIRGLSYHKVSTYIVLGTDSIIISVFLGVTTVGLYSNYLLVTTAILMIIAQLFTALTASVGNLLVSMNRDKSFEVYKKLWLGNFWLACLAATGLLVTMDSFISLWVGQQYLLSIGVLLAITLNMFLTIMRSATGSFKEAAGIFHEDRFVPVVESIANIVFSLTFLQIFGLAGVFLGTACSTLILHLYGYPKYVYKPLFKQPLSPYYRQLAVYCSLAVFICVTTFAISRAITIDGEMARFGINILLSLLTPNLLLFAIFRNTPEFRYYYALAIGGMRKVLKK